jgi:hypothetical protein
LQPLSGLFDLGPGLQGCQPEKGGVGQLLIQSQGLSEIGYDPMIMGIAKIDQPQSNGYLNRNGSVGFCYDPKFITPLKTFHFQSISAFFELKDSYLSRR